MQIGRLQPNCRRREAIAPPGCLGPGGEQGARLMPIDELPKRMAELDSARQIVLHCRSGGRSAQALRPLQAAGFRLTEEQIYGGASKWVSSFR